MSEEEPQQKDQAEKDVAVIASFAAGGLLFVSGLLTFLLGIGALFSPQLLNIEAGWVFKLNPAFWGWIHVVIGVVTVVVAVALALRVKWAAVAAISAAVASMVVMFLWLPYYPVWAFAVMALDVVVVWAVARWDISAKKPG